MTSPHAWHDQWRALDRTDDPQFFVRYLDMSRAQAIAHARSDPATAFSFLDVQPGHSILDVGCGTGDLTRLLAPLTGPNGRVVGLDISETMIAEARSRAAGDTLPVEFYQGDAQQLPFADDTFDRVQALIVFQHLLDPARALAELIRVTRPGGRVVVVEQDWDMQVVDAADHVATRKILHFFCDTMPHGRIGRQLPGLFQRAGLADVMVVCQTFTSSNPELLFEQMLRGFAERARDAGVISPAESLAWLTDQEERIAADRFFHAYTLFAIIGCKP